MTTDVTGSPSPRPVETGGGDELFPVTPVVGAATHDVDPEARHRLRSALRILLAARRRDDGHRHD
jgi:hypothetical protein